MFSRLQELSLLVRTVILKWQWGSKVEILIEGGRDKRSINIGGR